MRPRVWSVGLGVLLASFCVRVGAQLLQARFELPGLPGFDAWHAGLLPYPLLVIAQLGIVALLGRVWLDFAREQVRPSRTSACIWLGLGIPYLILMLVRLVLGLTVLTAHPWFKQTLPALFHLVLASFMLGIGAFHWRHAGARVDEPGSGRPQAEAAR